MSNHSSLLPTIPAETIPGETCSVRYRTDTTIPAAASLAELHIKDALYASGTTFGSRTRQLTHPVIFGTNSEHRSPPAGVAERHALDFSPGFSPGLLPNAPSAAHPPPVRRSSAGDPPPNRLDTPAPVRPIAFLGHSFEVHELAGARTVLRKGRQRYCWHVAKGRVAEIVLAGIDLQVVRS